MKFLQRILALLAAAAIPVAASAQAYPTKPVRLIVPFPAGGPADIFGRVLAQGMGANLGQTVVVENISGVGGVLGVDRAVKSAPDGYTLAITSATPLAIAPFSMTNMPFDVHKDVTLFTPVAWVPEVVVVNPSLPVNSLAELVAYAKARPGKVNFGSGGAGSITHLAGELLNVEASIKLVHVPYKGAAPAVMDILGGQVQMGIFYVPVPLPHIRAGKLKALALTSAKRAQSLPDVPTTAEAGLPNVLTDDWFGLVGPAGIPPSIAKRIHDAAVKSLNSRELGEQFAKVNGVPMPLTPEEYGVYVAQEQAKWGKLVKAIGFKAD